MPAPTPRLYLLTPLGLDPERFAPDLEAALDAGDVACVRLRPQDMSEAEARAAIRRLKPICHARDVAFLVADAVRLAADEDIDGVHFTAAGADLRAARSALGEDAVIGVFAGASRHSGLIAGERGADYVAFGPVGEGGALGPGGLAERETFEWWQTMIELPVVAEGGVTPEAAAALVGLADFLAIDRGVWAHPEGPAAGVRAYAAAIARAL